MLQFNQFLVFLPYVNFEKVAISSLRSLQNKVEKWINEIPELLPSLFKDFMEIKNLHLKIFYYRRHNKAGVSVLLAGINRPKINFIPITEIWLMNEEVVSKEILELHQ